MIGVIMDRSKDEYIKYLTTEPLMFCHLNELDERNCTILWIGEWTDFVFLKSAKGTPCMSSERFFSLTHTQLISMVTIGNLMCEKLAAFLEVDNKELYR